MHRNLHHCISVIIGNFDVGNMFFFLKVSVLKTVVIIVEGCAFVPPRQFIRTSGSFWERSWGGLGRVLGVLGESWALLGGTWGAFWGHLEGLGGFSFPSASWEASWTALGRF